MNLAAISSPSLAAYLRRTQGFSSPPYNAGMRRPILLFLVLWAGVAHAAVMHVPLKSGIVLKPGQAYTITVEATEPVEIGWLAVQSQRCTTNCIQATELTSGIHYSIATPRLWKQECFLTVHHIREDRC